MSACCELTECLEKMRDRTSANSCHHKEEMSARITKDDYDRSLIRKKLEMSIDVFDHVNHPKEGIVNIVSGIVITDSKVNVDDSINEGKKLMKSFEEKLPVGFYETIPQTIKTMDYSKRSIKVGDKKVTDSGIIYARALAMRWIDPNFEFESLLVSEMAPQPTSMFTEEGLPRPCNNKSKLTTTLKVKIPSRHASENTDAIFLDGCAILWTINWPSKGNINNFLNNVRAYLHTRLLIADVHLIFDRYFDHSIKGLTRKCRNKGGSRVYQLTPTTPLQPRDVILTVTENKVQLINLIVENIRKNPDIFNTAHKLVATGPDPIPFEIGNSTVLLRPDLKTNQEEADTILVHQVYRMGNGRCCCK